MKPHISLIMAVSLDGKISTRDGTGPRFTSEADGIRLREIRSLADAILVGAGTIIADDPTFTEHGKYRDLRLERGLAPNPVKAVVSGSGSVPETAQMFKPNGAPALVFTTAHIPTNRLEALEQVAEVHQAGDTTVNFHHVVEILGEMYRVKHLLIEGGGQVNFDLFQAGLIDEIYLTLCPKIIGGQDVVTSVEGAGFDFLEIVEVELIEHRLVNSEIFLHYRVQRN